eukprot:TRINITY_DN6336_c0_g1_i1.p1 TRINITY_DN6336_c0_g1~~TRINITY_DN6336_c0_g1_i1.p1  ORF type:complete len:128 (+),score=20.36 TRINITY_DN6336_c0_g1_i1:58-384(+)
MSHKFFTGNAYDDNRTIYQIMELLDQEFILEQCDQSSSFDETRLFQGEKGRELREKVQSAIQKINLVLDCVGCEKCKLHAKMELPGVGHGFRKSCFRRIASFQPTLIL